jgi:hypothetical protein
MRFAADSSGFPKLTLAVRLSPWKGERRARETFDEVMDSTLRVARTRQYEMFVASPDPAGSNRTTYVFHTVTARVAAIAPARRRGSGFPLGTVAVAVGLGALLAACVVAWAHA